MALSPTSEDTVNALWKHIAELHEEWKVLIELFGVSQEQSDLLNSSAGAFFETVYRTLMRDILLGISRLTDPLTTVGKDNLVLERLTGLPEVHMAQPLLSSVSAKLDEVKSLAVPIRDYRNKYLAHLDLGAALAPSPEVLPGIKRPDVEGVLLAMADLFNLISQPLRDTTVVFKDVAIMGGHRALLKCLDDARVLRSLPFEQRRQARQRAHG
jgi:hypothetical protein